MKTFIISYTIHLTSGEVINPRPMRVKNTSSMLEAKIKLNEYLKKKHSDFYRMEIQSCHEDFGFDLFNTLFGMR